VGSEADEDGNMRFPTSPPFAPAPDGLLNTLKRLYDAEVVLIGKGTPLDAFAPEESEEIYNYYPARFVWRFATLNDFVVSATAGRELAYFIDNPKNDYEVWNAVAEVWWNTAYAESVRYLNEQLSKYRLQATEGDALKQSIHHGLSHFSVPRLRNLLWRLAKDIGAYSAEVGVIKARAVNAIPGNLTRMVDRYVANSWDVTPYVLKWDEDECLVFTTLFDRVLKTGVTGFKTLTGNEIRQRRDEALKTIK
jgi:hypothetical protein